MKGYKWTDRDTGGVYWEILKDGKVVAEVGAPTPARNQWLWYVTLPPGWDNGRAPTGAAKSCEAAMLICETILAGTEGQ